MTAPRQVLAGTTYLVTRRCARRELLLRPSQTTNEIFGYLLAVAADRYGIDVHAYCVMSNHFHLVVTDPEARLPAFHQFLDALVARAMNRALDRRETFWAPNSYSAVALTSAEDVIDKAAYVLANPVAAGLVRSGRSWPGLWSAPAQIGGGAIDVARPKGFFGRRSSLPATAKLELTVPPGFESADIFREQLAGALEARERQAAEDRGGRFMGVARVLAQNPRSQPTTRERKRELNPRVAGQDKWKRVEALGRLVEFLRSYRAARAARAAGDHDAVFPPGTYQLRVMHAVRCATAA